tara:strand:+ start:408 stop:671 length:264 start_codon:yes stop_codon:yes gene_type:complete
LRWIVLPAGCVLGNSVNHLQIPEKVLADMISVHDDEDVALSWLCDLLNSPKLDVWARAWAANNNVNNYELELLPLPSGTMEMASKFA